jgi:hypothetical protein
VSDETKWSPEPWRVSASGFLCSATNLVLIDSRGDVPPADLCRIVACVNALAGIPTAALEAGALSEALDGAEWFSRVEGACTTAGIDAEEKMLAALRALGRLS